MSAIQQAIASYGGAAAPGQVVYDTPGSYTWTCPAGVTSVSVVVVGYPNSGGTAGALAYKNNISVTPGVGYAVVISNSDARSYFNATGTVSAGGGSARTGDGGGDGAKGAGGYSGTGGTFSGFSPGSPGTAGAGGAGGGGGYDDDGVNSVTGAGGGTGLLGAGSNGTAGSGGTPGARNVGGGGGGSGGTAGGGSTSGAAGSGGTYGGHKGSTTTGSAGTHGKSGLRIIWPGNLRSFPSTRTADE
jgi:hypothetical protein